MAEVNTPVNIIPRLISIGATPIQPDLAKLLLNGLPGRAFRLKTEVQPLYFLITADNTCTVSSRDADAAKTEAILLSFVPHTAIEPENVGSERYDYFAVSYNANPNLPGHALVIVHYSKLLPGVQIAMTPEANLIAKGITPPAWP